MATRAPTEILLRQIVVLVVLPFAVLLIFGVRCWFPWRSSSGGGAARP